MTLARILVWTAALCLLSVAPSSAATLDVCASGCQFSRIQKAVDAAAPGDTVLVKPGVYEQCVVVPRGKADLTLLGTGAHLTRETCQSKGILVVQANRTVIDGFELSGAHVGGTNIAGIRCEAQSITVRNTYIHDNQVGFLGCHESPDAVMLFEHTRWERNGLPDGGHNVYVSKRSGHAIFRDLRVFNTNSGHGVKSGAHWTELEDCYVLNAHGAASTTVEFQLGGKGSIKNCVLQKGPDNLNPWIVGAATEPFNDLHATHDITLENVTILNDKRKFNTFALATCPLDRPGCDPSKLKVPVTLKDVRIIGPLTAVVDPDARGMVLTEQGTVRHASRQVAGLPASGYPGVTVVESVTAKVASGIATISYTPATPATVYTAVVKEGNRFGCSLKITSNCEWQAVTQTACGDVTTPITVPTLVRVDNGGPSPVVKVTPQ